MLNRSLPSARSSTDNSKELNKIDLAWSKGNLTNDSIAEPLKKKPRSVSRDLCYVTVNYESSVRWILSYLKRNACLLLCAVLNA